MKETKKEVVVYDAIMGSGKTSNAIEHMNETKSNFIYVTPFLDEVKRIIKQVPNSYEPLITTEFNLQGETEVHYKRDNLLRMANRDLNLVTTHSLFSKLHRRDYAHFNNYDLILDEVLTPIEVIDMSPDDIEIAFNEGLLVLNDKTGEVIYTGDDYKGRFYAKLKGYCNTANVIYVNNRLLVWAFPPEIFKSFKSVTVLTYLFQGSLLSNYFQYYNITFKIIKETPEEEALIKNKIKELLYIYEGKCNKVGEFQSAFSVNWLRSKNSNDFKRIKTIVANLIDRHFETLSKDNSFTTFKSFESKLKGKGYALGFIPVNERATNKYSNKKTMIFLANRYLNPNIIDFFRFGSVQVDQDSWALAELLQWIWRGAIRNNEKMNLFIPSKRMRNLLMDWLNSADIKVVAKAA